MDITIDLGNLGNGVYLEIDLGMVTGNKIGDGQLESGNYLVVME